MRCFEGAAPNDPGKRIEIAIKGPGPLSADHLDQSLRLAGEIVRTGDCSLVTGGVAHAA